MKLFIPGPVDVEQDVLKEMTNPMIGHRTGEFRQLHDEIVERLKRLLKIDNDIFLITGSATGAMEAAIRNCVQEKVLCIANGAFGRRWFEIAKGNGKNANLMDFGDGNPYDYALICEELQKGYEAVTVVMNDTATGIENDLEPLKKILERLPNTLLLVDAVTAAFGTPIDFNGIDVLVFGTQKALALPPGLAIAIVDVNALKKARVVMNKGFYFDFIKLKKKADQGFTLTTPNIPLLFALRKRLEQIEIRGVNDFIEAHNKNTEAVRMFFRKKGFKMFIDEEHKSKTVTVVENTPRINVTMLIDDLKEHGILVANGYGDLKQKTFRIGHMGVGLAGTKALLEIFEEHL